MFFSLLFLLVYSDLSLRLNLCGKKRQRLGLRKSPHFTPVNLNQVSCVTDVECKCHNNPLDVPFISLALPP